MKIFSWVGSKVIHPVGFLKPWISYISSKYWWITWFISRYKFKNRKRWFVKFATSFWDSKTLLSFSRIFVITHNIYQQGRRMYCITYRLLRFNHAVSLEEFEIWTMDSSLWTMLSFWRKINDSPLALNLAVFFWNICNN